MKTKIGNPLVLVITITAILGFIAFFHVISYGDSFWGMAIIPKEHVSFSRCFVKVDDFVQEYNNSSIIDRMKDHYLVSKLEEIGALK